MKVILHDRNIVVRVVLSTDSDFDYHNDRGEGVTVANNFSVQEGNYIEDKENPVTVRESTKIDYVNRHGSQRSIPGDLLKPFLSSIDTSQETQEVLSAIQSIPNEDVDVLDDTCFIHSLSEVNKREVYRAFGIIDFDTVYEMNPQYHLVQETTTTTEAPAE